MEQSNLTPEQILEMAKNLKQKGRSEQQMQKELSDMLMKKLDKQKGKKLQEIIKDKAAMERLMNSEQAKQLLKRFGNRPQ